MRIKHTYLLLALLACASCSPLEKAIKSRDYNTMYSLAMDYYQDQRDSKAIALFETVESVFSGTEKADTIAFYKAKSYYRRRDYPISSVLFDEFRNRHSRSPFLEEAEYLYAMSYFDAAPIPELDQSYSMNAISAFTAFINRYPNSSKIESCLEMIDDLQQRIYDKAYIVAQTYYNIGSYNSAITSFRNVLRTYPDIPHREKILYMTVKSNYQFAKASVENKQRERFYNTMDAYHNFITEYPDSQYKTEALRMFENATKYAKGGKAIVELGGELDLSNRKIKQGERKINKAIDKVDKGKLSENDLEKIAEQKIDKAKQKKEIKTEKKAAKQKLSSDNKQ